jgi:prevent-host-death family protein
MVSFRTGEGISMTRRKVTATELKNHLGAYLEAAIAAPVFVEKSGREVAVLMSHEYYTYLQASEDRWWGEQAKLAEQRGFLGVEETARALEALQPQEDEDVC